MSVSGRLLSLEIYAKHFDRLFAGLFAAGILLALLRTLTGAGGDIITSGDAAEHFEYARSVMAEGHLPRTPIRFPSGLSMVGAIGYAPAFLAAKGLVALGLIEPSPRLLSGWSLPLQLAYCAPLFLLSFLGFRANVGMMRCLGYDGALVRAMLLFWIVTTNVGFYALEEPARGEATTYALVSIYYWMLVRWFWAPPANDAREPADTATVIRRALLLGLVLGAAGAVRQQNILHSLSLPLILLAQHSRRGGSSGNLTLARGFIAIAVTAAASAAIFIVPYFTWAAAFGELPMMSYPEGKFYWLSPRPWLVLFVPGYHGLFAWHPAFALAAVGIIPFLRRQRELSSAWIVALLAQLYLISTWYWLSYATSIGHRGFFPVLPLLFAGFVAFADLVHRKGRTRTLIAALYLLAAANAVMTVLVLLRLIDRTWGYPPHSGF